MLSWEKRVEERKNLECKSFLSYVFKDVSFPPECDNRIKIKTFFSVILSPFYADNLEFYFTYSRILSAYPEPQSNALPEAI